MKAKQHELRLDDALDALASDSDVAAHEYRDILERTARSIADALRSLREEGLA